MSKVCGTLTLSLGLSILSRIGSASGPGSRRIAEAARVVGVSHPADRDLRRLV
jgi:hypothetical protein